MKKAILLTGIALLTCFITACTVDSLKIDQGDLILFRPYGVGEPILHRVQYYVENGTPMWDGGPDAPYPGYITKGDSNEVTDQQAGRIFGMANESYIKAHQGDIIEVDKGSVYLDRNTGLVIYKLNNDTYVGEGISYLTPIKSEWIIGVMCERNESETL